jgi:hypothetical protein
MGRDRIVELLGRLMHCRKGLKLVTKRRSLDLRDSNPCRTEHGCILNIVLVIMSKHTVINVRVSMPKTHSALLTMLYCALGREFYVTIRLVFM